MARVGELEVEAELRHPVARRLRRARQDVHVVLGEHLGDVAQQPRPVERLDLDRHDERGRLVVVPLDLDDPLGVVDETGRVARSRCGAPTRPRPRVTKPMISSPGTGVQQRDSRTMTSSRPSTWTPVARRSEPRRAFGRTGGGDGQLLLAAAQLASGAAAPPPWPTRGSRRSRRRARRGRRSASRRHVVQRRRRRQLLHRQAVLAAAPWPALRGRCRSRRPRRSRENHWRIFVRACGVCTNCSQSRLGPAPSTLLVKISTVSPDASVESSGTSRPFTRAPMQRWPTSVWIAYGEVDRRAHRWRA